MQKRQLFIELSGTLWARKILIYVVSWNKNSLSQVDCNNEKFTFEVID